MLTFSDVKNYLNITWVDEIAEKKLAQIIVRATAIMRNLIGNDTLVFVSDANHDDITGTQEEQLFLDCCRYINSNAYEDFAVNFASEILTLRIKYSVEYVENEADDNA